MADLPTCGLIHDRPSNLIHGSFASDNLIFTDIPSIGKEFSLAKQSSLLLVEFIFSQNSVIKKLLQLLKFGVSDPVTVAINRG